MVQKEQVNDFESSLCKERKKKEEKREKMTIDQTNSTEGKKEREYLIRKCDIEPTNRYSN